MSYLPGNFLTATAAISRPKRRPVWRLASETSLGGPDLRFTKLFIAMIAVVVGIVAAGCQRKTPANAPANTPQPAKEERASVAAEHSKAQKVTLEFIKVDSEETTGETGYGENAVDGDPSTFWHTEWHGTSPGPPHEIILELLPPSTIKGFTYLPRQDESDHGTIKEYEFYVSDDGRNFGQPVAKGAFEPGKKMKTVTFEAVKCSFIKLKAISEINGLPYTSAAEIGVIVN
jgi:hypothetical protein